ncbi:MAG: efflux RND transporter periplasmic adaptor subunit [Armatimonadetes bacterium]|nr:efflux RND transporter periplasmic adaptor subunit [Armatimonadota bacterium]
MTIRRLIWVVMGLVAAGGSLLAGTWVARTGVLWRAGGPPPVLRGTLQSAAVDVRAAIAGRVRLVAVREGDRVKAGQLIAWMDAPELRDAARAAQETAREAQRRLDSLRAGLPGGPQEAHARARTAHAAARRALAEAEELAGEEYSLSERVPAAREALDAAQGRLQDAEARLAQARALSGSPGEPGGGAPLESNGATEPARPETGAPTGDAAPAGPAEAPEVAAARQSAAEARERRDATRRAQAALERRLEAARAASNRLASLAARARAAADAADAARWEMESQVAVGSRESEERELRREVRAAQAEAARARVRLRETLVVAPAPGIVEHVSGVAGEEVSSGRPIATIRRLDALWTDITIPRRDARRVRVHEEVAVRSVSRPDLALKGTTVSGEVTDGGADAPATVRVAVDNPGGQLRPGDEVDVTLP